MGISHVPVEAPTKIDRDDWNAAHVVVIAGAAADGSTDDTDAFQDAIDALYAAGGGDLIVPAGTYRINGQLTIPYGTTSETVDQTVPISILGAGALISGNWDTAVPTGGTILDMRSATSPAKLVALGSGQLRIEGITFSTGLNNDTNPFLFFLGTTPRIRDCAFVGDPDLLRAQCVQDAIILGGTNASLGMAVTDGFQGYGAVIEHNLFHHIRRCVHARMWANSVWITNNTVSNSCGSTDGTAAAFHSVGGDSPHQNAGLVIRDNLIECAGYPYPIRLEKTIMSLVDGNAFWDGNLTEDNLAAVYLDSDCKNNRLINLYNGTNDGSGNAPFVTEQTVGQNSITDPAVNTDWAGTTFEYGNERRYGELSLFPSTAESWGLSTASASASYYGLAMLKPGAGHAGIRWDGATLSFRDASPHTFDASQWNNQALALQVVGTAGVGFYGTAPGAKPTITGSRGSNAALASLLTALATLGLITDSTS